MGPAGCTSFGYFSPQSFLRNVLFNLLQIINTETRSIQEEISQEKQEILVMKVTPEAELEAAAGFRKQTVSLRKGLNKARAKIRRLEN